MLSHGEELKHLPTNRLLVRSTNFGTFMGVHTMREGTYRANGTYEGASMSIEIRQPR